MIIMTCRLLPLAIAVVFLASGCGREREDLDYDFEVEQTWVTNNAGDTIVQFVSVPYQPLNSALLRNEIVASQRVDSRRILELGCGTGYFAIHCAAEGAKQVVSLAPSRVIHACVRYNVALAQEDSFIECRLIEPTADAISAAIPPTEKFDYVVLNTETTLDEPLINEAIGRLPIWLRGGGKGWVICETAAVKTMVTSRCEALGFAAETMQTSNPSQTFDPTAFPQTLQIDPFTPAAMAATGHASTDKAQSPAAGD